MKKEKVFPRLMNYAGKHKFLTYLSLILSAISGVFAIMPFVYIYFIIRDVVQVAPDFQKLLIWCFMDGLLLCLLFLLSLFILGL